MCALGAGHTRAKKRGCSLHNARAGLPGALMGLRPLAKLAVGRCPVFGDFVERPTPAAGLVVVDQLLPAITGWESGRQRLHAKTTMP